MVASQLAQVRPQRKERYTPPRRRKTNIALFMRPISSARASGICSRINSPLRPVSGWRAIGHGFKHS